MTFVFIVIAFVVGLFLGAFGLLVYTAMGDRQK